MPESYIDQEIVTEVVGTIISNDMKDIDKAGVIYDWVVGNVDYGYEELLRGDAPYRIRTTKEALESGEGNCLEQSLVWLSMAKAAGIKDPYLVEETFLGANGYRHYLPAFTDEKGEVHGYEISFRKKDDRPSFISHWEHLPLDDVEIFLKESGEEIGDKVTNGLLLTNVVPMKVTSYTSDDALVYEFHHIRWEGERPHIDMIIHQYRENGKTTERMDIECDSSSHSPVSIDYRVSEEKPFLHFFKKDRTIDSGHLDIIRNDTTGDQQMDERIQNLYDKVSDIRIPEKPSPVEGEDKMGLFSKLMLGLAFAIKKGK